MNYTIDLSQDTKDFIKEMLKLYGVPAPLEKPKLDESSPEYWYSEEGQRRLERIREYNKMRGLL